MSRRDEFEALDAIYGDLPDGAYFAAMEEAGFDIYDIAEMDDEEDEA